MRKFRVEADIEYMNGALAGLNIPSGWHVTVPASTRDRTVAWVLKVWREKDHARSITGARFRFTSAPRVYPMPA